MNLIKKDWMTKNVKLSSNRQGTVVFRGLYGNYQITVTKPDGSQKTLAVHLVEKGDNQWTFTL